MDKYDGMGIGIENKDNVIADEEDARYDAGIALGDPETAPLRIVALHSADAGGSSFILKCIYNEFDEETYDNKLLQCGDQHQMQYKYEYELEDDKPETLTSETLRLSVFDMKGFDNSQTKNEMNERIGQIMQYSNTVLLMYSIEDKSSFDGDFSIKAIKQIFDEELQKVSGKKICILVGTKCDSEDRKISIDSGEKLGQEWKIPFIEISSKTGVNMKQLIEKICEIHKKYPNGTNYPPPPENSGCCIIL